MAGLDDKTANKLSPLDLSPDSGQRAGTAYLNFGMVFLAAKRDELAVKAFERGLIYDEENPQIPLLLAETLLKLNKGQQALALVERLHQAAAPSTRSLRADGQGAHRAQARK